MNIDRRDLYARLYACIPELALLPLHPDDGSLHDLLSQGNSNNKINIIHLHLTNRNIKVSDMATLECFAA